MNEADTETVKPEKKKGNNITTWGNATTMNINNMIHTNILSSPYFKNELFKLKTYHEVIDEIYYKVDHLEPWEKGSRKTSGQVGMCGGVRGVGAGGIVSTAYCLLFKLFTLNLTRKQLKGLLDHPDSPYIRGLGFLYIRYCLHPKDFWDWLQPYLEDEEEIDVKAGGGCTLTVGQMVRSMLIKLDWYGTLFPRIPVPIEKVIRQNLTDCNLCDDHKRKADEGWGEAERYAKSKRDDVEKDKPKKDDDSFGEAERYAKMRRNTESSRPRSPGRSDRGHERSRRSRSKDRRSREDSPRRRGRDKSSRDRSKHRSRSRERSKRRSRSRSRERSKGSENRERGRDKDHRDGKERPKHKSRSKSRERHREKSHTNKKDRSRHLGRSRSRDKRKSRSRSRDRHHKST